MAKRTFQPSNIVRKRRHGFRSRMATANGRKIIANRRAKGRKSLSAQIILLEEAVLKASQDDLQKLQTLKNRKDFVAANTHAKKWVAETMVVQCLAHPESDKIQIGITATKKLGNAVIRNRVKRRLRSAAADILTRKGQAGHAYVFIGRPATLTASADKLRSDLKWCLKRLHDNKN